MLLANQIPRRLLVYKLSTTCIYKTEAWNHRGGSNILFPSNGKYFCSMKSVLNFVCLYKNFSDSVVVLLYYVLYKQNTNGSRYNGLIGNLCYLLQNTETLLNEQ